MNTWFRFYNEVIDDPKVQLLSANLFRIWVNLLCLCSANNGFLPSLKTIGYKLRLSPARVTRIIDELCEYGLFDKLEKGTVPHNWDNRQFKSDTSRERTAKWRAKRHGDVTSEVTVTAPDTYTDTYPPIVPQNGDGHGLHYTPEFESFWNAYPNRVGKGAAFKIWQRLKPSRELQSKISRAIAIQSLSREWSEDRGKYIPHPATWLNQSRWDDEPPTKKLKFPDIVV